MSKINKMNDELVNIGIVSLLTWLFITFYNRFLSMIFVLNFSTAGLNITAVISLLFVIPSLLYFIIEKKEINEKDNYLTALASILLITTIIGIFFTAFLKSLFAGVGLSMCTLILIQMTRIEHVHYVRGIAFGFVLNFITTITFSGLSPYSTTFGQIILVVFSTVLISAILLAKGEDVGNMEYDKWAISVAILTYAALLIANPFVIGAWTFDTDLSLLGFFIDLKTNLNFYSGILTISGILSVALFVEYFEYMEILERRPIIIYFLFIISTVFIVLIPVMLLLMYGLNIITALTLIHLSKRSKREYFGAKSIGVLFILLLLTFLFIISGHWAFLPSAIHSITQGFAGIYALLIVCFTILISEIYPRRNNL